MTEEVSELVAELRRLYHAINPAQLMLALDPVCEWHANNCMERARQRVVTYVATTVLVIEDRLLCDAHAALTFLAGNIEGFRAESILLPDPHDPKQLDLNGNTVEPVGRSKWRRSL